MVTGTLHGLHLWLLIICVGQASSVASSSTCKTSGSGPCPLYISCMLRPNGFIRYAIFGEVNVSVVECYGNKDQFTKTATIESISQQTVLPNSQYSGNSQSLTALNVTSDIEGVYRCNGVEQQCVFVKGLVIFESCSSGMPTPFYSQRMFSKPTPPFDDTICIDMMDVMEGDNITFDIGISFTGSGSCGCEEDITGITLTKYGPNEPGIGHCSDHNSCKSDMYVHTLINVTPDKAGLYLQTVMVSSPRQSTDAEFYKLFNLTVLPSDQTMPTATPTATPTSTLTIATSPAVTVNTTTSQPPSTGDTRTIAAAAASVVVILLLFIAFMLTLAFTLFFYRHQQVSWRQHKTSMVICANINKPGTAEPSGVNRYSLCVELTENNIILDPGFESSAFST